MSPASSTESIIDPLVEMSDYKSEMSKLASDVQRLRDEIDSSRRALFNSNRDHAKLMMQLDEKANELTNLKLEYNQNLDVLRDDNLRLEMELSGEKRKNREIADCLVDAEAKVRVSEGHLVALRVA